MSDAVIEKLYYAYAKGATDEQACFYADISVKTLHNYQDRNPKFLQRKAALKHNPVMLARETVVNDLKKNVETAKWYLERRMRSEFGAKVEQEVNINVSFNNGIPRPKQLKDDTTYSVPDAIEGEVVDK